MLRSLGKVMQFAGLVVLPVAMLLQLTSGSGLRAPAGTFSVSAMLVLMVFGAVLFVLGRYIEGYAR
jgi:hypothetical protein